MLGGNPPSTDSIDGSKLDLHDRHELGDDKASGPQLFSGLERDSKPEIDHSLGRDDPLWPRYVQEGEKWDDIMMGKWNSDMDVLLLFATLFSAIVTAFVIETSGSLEPDNTAISASALIQIAETLRVLASGEQPSQNFTTPIPSPESFEPSKNEFLVNLLWFISLCLSITVALLASLVKQWCNSFTSDRTAPPCNQARIRQARLNKMMTWRAGLIVSALPVIMHLTVGLFLVGLIIFLRDLNYTIYLATLAITTTTVVFYAGTTIIPIFSSFSPYGTPLSSLKTWGYFYQCFLYLGIYIYKVFADTDAQADLVNFRSPCEQKVQKLSYNTVPDEITGHALNWIITHSQNSKTRDMAIRAIAGLNSEKTLKQLVADPPGIFPQVVQSFTACFSPSSRGEEGFKLVPKKSIDDVALHGTALAILANRTALDPYYEDPDSLVKWGVDDATKVAVKDRFEWLAVQNNENSDAKAMGLAGLSAWYNFIGHKASRFNHGDIIDRLTQSIDWSLPEHLCTRVLHALMAESIFWAPDVDNEHRMRILTRLVELLPQATSDKLRFRLACSLAVLVLGLNRGSAHLKAWIIPHPDVDTEAGSTHNLAETLAEYYTKQPHKIDRDGQALMLFALTGLMEHYEHCNFDDGTHASMKIIAEQILGLDNLGKSRPITLPKNTGLYLDVRGYFVETLVAYLKQVQAPERSDAVSETFVQLLKAVRSKRQVWIEHGQLLVLPIIQVLAQTDNAELICECLSTIITNWDLGPSLSYSCMLLSANVLHKLVKRISRPNSEEGMARTIINSNTAMVFEKLATQVENNYFVESAGPLLLSFLENILQDNLLYTLARMILGLQLTPQPSNSQELETPSPLRTQELFSHVLLYNETLHYLKQRQPEQGAKLRGAELFLKTLFDLQTQKRGIDHWQLSSPSHGKPRSVQLSSLENAQLNEPRPETEITVPESGLGLEPQSMSS